MRLNLLLLSLIIFCPLSVGTEDYDDYNFDYDDYDDYDGTDIYVPPPETNPARGFFQGPLPSSVELNLTLIYDLDLLKQFHGRKDYVKDFLMRIVELARPHLQQHNLKVQIHIKVTLHDNLYNYRCLLFMIVIMISNRGSECLVIHVKLIIHFSSRLPVSKLFEERS